jgi:hypothetical protein
MIVCFILVTLFRRIEMSIDEKEVERVMADAKRIEFIVSTIKAVLIDKTANQADWNRVKRSIDLSIIDLPLTFDP